MVFLSSIASFIEVTVLQTTWWLTKRVASATYHGARWVYTQATKPKLESVVVVVAPDATRNDWRKEGGPLQVQHPV